MTRFLTYAVAGLLLALYITVSLYIERGREIAALQGEKSALSGKTSFLEAEIAKRDEKALDADKRLCEIEKAAAAEKVRAAQAKEGGFDWDSPLPADAVTLQLRQDLICLRRGSALLFMGPPREPITCHRHMKMFLDMAKCLEMYKAKY